MYDYEREKFPIESEPGRDRRGFIRALLLWLPLMACAGCLFVSYMLLPPMTADGIPVTGSRDPLIPPTPTAGAPSAQPPAPPAPPGFSYRDEALLRLDACNASFHDFFVVEQIAIHQPEVAAGSAWRAEAERAVQSFRDNCEPLGSLPAAPAAYTQVDTWLKLAAGEVAPAVEGFSVMLDADDPRRQDRERMSRTVDHLIKFLEYTTNAEDLIDRLQLRKQF